MLRWKGRIWDGSSPGRLGGKTRCHPQPFGVQGWTDLFVHHLLALQNSRLQEAHNPEVIGNRIGNMNIQVPAVYLSSYQKVSVESH